MQKRIKRIMTNNGFGDPSLPLFAKLNILQVDEGIKLEVAKLMHTVLGNDKPQFKKLKLSAQIHGYQTRHSTQLNYFLPRKRIETGKKKFSNFMVLRSGKRYLVISKPILLKISKLNTNVKPAVSSVAKRTLSVREVWGSILFKKVKNNSSLHSTAIKF